MQASQQCLRNLTVPGSLYSAAADQQLQCHACAQRCRIAPGAAGICQVRWNQAGTLQVPWGYVHACACDPVEKKPFYHFYPGTQAFSFGMLGCNFRCSFCQNWISSQVLRDPQATAVPKTLTLQQLCDAARASQAPIIASTYNEPLISSEWAQAVFAQLRVDAMATCYVSNGFATAECIEYLAPWLDAINIDLKCFRESSYKKLGGSLQPVLECIAEFWRRSIWVEVVTLLIPGFNDSDAEITAMAEFVAGISCDLPWHVSAYHAAYKDSAGPQSTPMQTLQRALQAGQGAGLHYVYVGNVADARRYGNTHCPRCDKQLIARRSFGVVTSVLNNGACPDCGTAIAGRWTAV